jgi:hypothetical protein
VTAVSASAQITPVAPPKTGYVVKIEGPTAWLDLTAADGAAVGRPFTVFAEGEELKHPVTGASLGKTEAKLGEGTIKEVAEKFSVGDLKEAAPIKPGARVRLGAPPAPVAPVVAPPTVVIQRRPGEAELRAPRTRGAALPYVIVGFAVGDFDGIGKPQVVVSDETEFHLYEYPVPSAKPLVDGKIAGTGARIVSLEAGDADGDGKAELFVTLYNEPFRRVETIVYKLESGKFLKAAELPFIVRSHQAPDGKRVFATQQLQDDKSFPFGAIYPLVVKDGKYEQGGSAIRPKRVDWIYGFSYAQLDEGEPALLYLTAVNSLRAQFKKGHWRSSESFGQSPTRLRWHERMLEFHPPMLASYGEKGFDTLYVVRNLAMLGGLANPFGLFNGGEIHAKSWTGVAFDTKWKAELGGASLGFALVEPEKGRKELVVAVAGATGKSSVWTFDP